MAKASAIRVLGVDPGTIRLGYGLIEVLGSAVKVVASGVVAAPATWETARRLARIAGELGRLIEEAAPSCLALEASFFGKDPHALIRLGEARGMVLALAGARGLAVHDYPPATVKKSVTGNGGASKEQVARVLAALLPELGRAADHDGRLDRTDAIAVAWCHIQKLRLADRIAAVARARR